MENLLQLIWCSDLQNVGITPTDPTYVGQKIC